MALHTNWREILAQAYTVRVTLAATVADLLVAWHTKEVTTLIPAVLSLLVILARITAQPELDKTEDVK